MKTTTLRIQHYFGIVLLLYMLIIPTFEALAFQNEPDGFQGIKWGTNIKDLPEMTKTPLPPPRPVEKMYFRKDDKRNIGDASASIFYLFYEGRSSSMWIMSVGEGNSLLIRDTLIAQYGDACSSNVYKSTCIRNGEKVRVEYFYDNNRKLGSLSYIYKPIEDEIMADANRRVRDSIRKGADDL